MSSTAPQRPCVPFRRRRHRVGAALTAGAAACVLALAGCGGGGTQDKPADAVGAADEQDPTASEPSAPSSEDALAEWQEEVSPHWDDLLKAFDGVANSTDTDSLSEACSKGLDVVVALQQLPPYPPNKKLWNSMLDHVSAGFASCVSGDQTEATTQLAFGVAELKQLRTDMDEHLS